MFTMASTEAASWGRYDDSRVAASSLTDVRTSRTMVCASTPLMKIGTGSQSFHFHLREQLPDVRLLQFSDDVLAEEQAPPRGAS